jgi:hypothetical protein
MHTKGKLKPNDFEQRVRADRETSGAASGRGTVNVAGRSTGSLDLMPKLQISARVIAAALLFVVGAIPVGIWIILLTVPTLDPEFAKYSFSSENEYRWLFITMTASAAFSLIAAVLLAVVRRPLVVQSAFVGAIAQSIAYAMLGGWFMVAFAVAPLWWLYRAKHEV